MKLLLYCTKSKPYLYKSTSYKKYYAINEKSIFNRQMFNGKIVAECDYEVHKIIHTDITDDDFSYGYYNDGKNVRICKDSCLTKDEIFDYLYNGYVDNGYAIHIKNLHVFDESKELSDYYTFDSEQHININYCKPMTKAPQNMRYCWEFFQERYILASKCFRYFAKNVLISVKPEWLCKILNGEKTIEVRKKVLKEMLK